MMPSVRTMASASSPEAVDQDDISQRGRGPHFAFGRGGIDHHDFGLDFAHVAGPACHRLIGRKPNFINGKFQIAGFSPLTGGALRIAVDQNHRCCSDPALSLGNGDDHGRCRAFVRSPDVSNIKISWSVRIKERWFGEA